MVIKPIPRFDKAYFHSFVTHSDLLADKDQKSKNESHIDLREFNGKTVIIGSTARTLGDYGPSPVDKIMPKVYLQANTINTILQRLSMKNAPIAADLFILFIFIFLVNIITRRKSVLKNVMMLAAIMILAKILNFILFLLLINLS